MLKKLLFVFVICFVLIGAAVNIKLPYYITMPGSAEPLAPLVHVEGGHKEAGKLMLVTVKIGEANIFSYVLAHFLSYYELLPTEAVRTTGETDEQYNHRQLMMMEGSKEAAIAVAYKEAKKTIEYNYNGVFVTNTEPNMPAYTKLKAGDKLTKIDNNSFKQSEQFINYLKKKKKGDIVTISFMRQKEVKEAKLTLAAFKDQPQRAGIGVLLADDIDLKTTPKVEVDSEDIGGPSAGLMFSLEIYNQLMTTDLTHGLAIAGTGTINEKGEVGPIGGISQKIVAADREGAKIFFAPNEYGKVGSNYKEAVKTAKDIGTDMKIIPIDTFRDAVKYLEKEDFQKGA